MSSLVLFFFIRRRIFVVGSRHQLPLGVVGQKVQLGYVSSEWTRDSIRSNWSKSGAYVFVLLVHSTGTVPVRALPVVLCTCTGTLYLYALYDYDRIVVFRVSAVFHFFFLTNTPVIIPSCTL